MQESGVDFGSQMDATGAWLSSNVNYANYSKPESTKRIGQRQWADSNSTPSDTQSHMQSYERIAQQEIDTWTSSAQTDIRLRSASQVSRRLAQTLH